MSIMTKDEFCLYAEQGNLIPVQFEVPADTETPVTAYWKITNCGESKGYSFLLESVEGGENIGRYSFLGADPKAVFIHNCKGKSELIHNNGTVESIDGADVFEKVRRIIDRYNPVEPPGLPPFTGGAIGYTSYDVVSEFETTVPMPENDPVAAPDAVFMITDSILVFDKVKHTINIIIQAYIQEGADPEAVYDETILKIEKIKQQLRSPATFQPVELDESSENINFSSNKTKKEFHDMVNSAKKLIYDGDIIQVVLSQRFETDISVHPLSVHRALRMLNPSPYMFLLSCGDFSLVGASPEVHAKCVDRKITVRPIAGTRKRGKTPEEDQSLQEELLADPKERAEHIMLVDLGRNDVGRIAETGSVNVDELMVIEKYSHVIHIVSNVTAVLDEKYSSDAVMRSTFPAGTLSGAPKVRAMQIISEQEKEKRGPYGGAVVHFSFNGNLNSCITIRTAVLKDGKAYVQAGAGIVADSDPDSEYTETINKAKAMMNSLSMSKNFVIPE
jgi:anthranilate synthase component 1